MASFSQKCVWFPTIKYGLKIAVNYDTDPVFRPQKGMNSPLYKVQDGTGWLFTIVSYFLNAYCNLTAVIITTPLETVIEIQLNT